MTLLDDFLVRAALAGLGLVLATAPLGAFVVWRRMAYFGDATGHAAILGVALAVALSLPVTLGVLLVAALFSALLLRLTRSGQAADTVLGVLSHGALAIGLVAVALVPGPRLNLEALLFGDILSVGVGEVALIWAGGLVVASVVAWRWGALLTTSLGGDMARAAGLDPDRESVVLTALLALTVALALKIVGALLISAMLILPAAAARPLSRSPEGMVMLSAAIGAASVVAGLALSLALDTPAGPSIILAATVAYAVTHLSAARDR